MRTNTMIASVLLCIAGIAQAGTTIPTNLEFPHKNAEATDAVYKMADHPNTVFVFEALGLSCGYCNQNAPNVDKLAEEFSTNDRVQVLDLSTDTRNDQIAEWIRRHKPNHPVIQDVGRTVFNALRTANAIPQVFVVNCKGEMVTNYVGSWDESAKRKIRAGITKGLETVCE